MDFLKKLQNIWEQIKDFFTQIKEKITELMQPCMPAFRTIGRVFKDIGYVLKLLFRWMYMLKGLFLSIPVAFAAIALALESMKRLPEEVGIGLLANGEYAYMISRGWAANIPLIITGICLVMVLCSRRVTYPWLISVFSLAIPILLMVTSSIVG